MAEQHVQEQDDQIIGVVFKWSLAVIDAWEGDRAAVEQLYARADTNPNDSTALAWAERIATRGRDLEAAERYGQLLGYATSGGGTIPGQEVRVEANRWLKATPAGTVTWYAGQWLYRRPTTMDLIPPGLPRLIYVAPRSADRGRADSRSDG